MIKKIVLFVLTAFVVCSLFSFFSCGESEPQNNQNENGSVYVAPGKVIDGYMSDVFSSYAVPPDGTWNYDSPVSEALKEYAKQNVTYFLGLTIFSSELSGALEVGSDELTAELERLGECGYHVGYSEAWTYRGLSEQVQYAYVAGYFTADELENFMANENYGYFFDFRTNGDNSPIPAKQGIVANYDWGEGFSKS